MSAVLLQIAALVLGMSWLKGDYALFLLGILLFVAGVYLELCAKGRRY
jgi:hypothetical protein